MKKRILSIALVLCMIFAVLPTEVFADDTTVQGSGTESDPWILKMDTILNYRGSVVKSEYYKLPSGYYKLGENMDIGIALYVSDGSVTLDLNGCELNRKPNDEAVHIPGSTKLTIRDSKSGGKIMGYGSGIYMFGGASLTLDGGTVNTIATTGKNHTITINGGTVTGGIFGGYGWVGGKPFGTVLIANDGTVNGHVTCK